MTVTIQASQNSQDVMVPILGDNILETVEQFTAHLSPSAGQDRVMLGASMSTVEIMDDDCRLFVSLRSSSETL